MPINNPASNPTHDDEIALLDEVIALNDEVITELFRQMEAKGMSPEEIEATLRNLLGE